MFWRRVLSIFALAPLVFLIVYQGGWFHVILISAAALIMQIEYCKLVQHVRGKLNPVMPVLLTVVFCCFAQFFPAPAKTFNALLLFSFFAFVSLYVFAESILSGKVEGELETVALKFTGIITIGWLFGYHLILLRYTEDIGRPLLFLLMGVVWGSDTGAYLVGKAIGKHRLNTPVRPRKTVEGTIAGLIVGILISLALTAWLLQNTFSLTTAALIGLILSALGQFGDLSASLIKRTARVKDSGDVIPGHGGFLDRCDSLIFSTPALYYYTELMRHLA